MEDMDPSTTAQPLISIFQADQHQPQLRQVMNDMTTLAGVISELSSKEYFQSPLHTLRFLRVLNIIHEEALGLASAIENEHTIFYRYRHQYGNDPDMSLPFIQHLVYVLAKYNWIMKSAKRIHMRDVGKRMMDVLIRLANDSLAYYMNDEVARSLFQAKRDAELSEAYDDKGISGGNKLASMIKNVENAIELLKERQLEYLADRNALPQVQIINELMRELEQKMQERFERFKTFEEGLPLAALIQKGTEVMTEGTKISVGTINKILKFSSLQQTGFNHVIHPELFRRFIIQTFDSPADSEIPDMHQMLSFMEQGNYPGEEMDGLWVPVKFASPISPQAIQSAIDYLENYQPITEEIDQLVQPEYHEPSEIPESQLEQVMHEWSWQMTKQFIDTKKLEEYLLRVDEASLDELLAETGGETWSDALNGLIGVAALIGNRRAEIRPPEAASDSPHPAPIQPRDWKWIDDEQGTFRIRRTPFAPTGNSGQP